MNISSDVNIQGATDLQINGPSRRLNFTSGTGTVRTTTSNKLFLQTNSTDALTIDASQNVGIGTPTPDVKLEVVVTSPTDGIIADFVNDTNAGGTTAAIKLSNADSEACDVVLGANRVNANFGSDFFISLSDNVDGTNQERFRITEAGNVGIGTASPNDKLEIYGNMRVRGSDGFGANTTASYNPSYVAYPGGGKVGSSSSTQAGYIKITLPQSWTNTMMQFSVDVFEYSDNKTKTFKIAGYNYSPSGGSWHKASATVLAGNDSTTYRVEFGHDGSKCAIYISKGTDGASSSWVYPFVVVRDASFSWNSIDISNWIDGWDVSFSTATLSGITQTRDVQTQVTGAGTSQYIPKWNSTGTALNDSVIVQNSSNIGIGTNNPQTNLEIIGGQYSSNYPSMLNVVDDETAFSTNNNGGGISFGANYASGTIVRFIAGIQGVKENNTSGNFGGALRFLIRENGTSLLSEKMRIDSSGNVGIGTASPDGVLHLASTASSVQRLIFSNSNSNLNPQQRIEFWENTGTGTAANANCAIEYDGAGTYQSSDGTLLIKGSGSSADLPIAGFNRNGNVYLGMSGIARVGISTTSPAEKLHIGSGASETTNSFVRVDGNASKQKGFNIYGDGTEQWRIYTSSSSSDLRFYDGSNVTVTFEDGGNVGIGTTSPDGNLEIWESAVDTAASLRLTGDPNAGSHTEYANIIFHSRDSGTGANGGEAQIRAYRGSDRDAPYLNFDLANTGGTLQQVMTIHGQNNAVGIGTTSPSVKLEVKDSQDSSIDSGIGIVRSANSQTGYINMVGGAFNFNAPSAIAIKFRDGGTTNMTILGDGNVGIGTVSPSNRLHIQHSAATTDQALFIQNINGGGDAGIKFSDTPTGTQNGIFYYSHVDTSSNGTANSFHFNSDQTNLAVIIDQTNANSGYYIGESSPVVAIRGGGHSFFNGGNVGIGTTNPGTTLDVRGIVSVRESSNVAFYGGNYIRLFGNTSFWIRETGGAIRLNFNTTTGDLSLYNSSTVLTNHIDTNGDSFFNGGNVGIGTVIPGGKLHVYGGTTAFTNLSDNTDSVQITRNTSVHSHPDAKLFIYDNSNSDWAQKISLDGYSYGLRIDGWVDYGLYLNHNTLGVILVARSSELVINDTGNDYNFRVEGDTDQNLLFVDAGTDSVGIGGSPNSSYKLDVSGDTLIQESESGDLKLVVNNVSTSTLARSAISLINNSGSSAGFALPSTNYTGITGWANRLILNTDSNISNGILVRPSTGGFTVSANGLANTNLRVDTNGRVGIGTGSPSAKLEIKSDGAAAGGAEIRLTHANNNSTDVVSTVNFANNVGSVAMIQGGTTGANNTGYISFFTDNAGTSSEKVRIIADGNVGIGTTIPSQKLDVRGNFRLNGAIAQYSTAANSTVLNRFWNNTGGVLLAELALYDFGTSLVGGQLSFGEGISKYATLRGTNTDGGKLTLETTSSSTNVIINGNGDTVFNETGAAFDFRIEGDVDPNLFFVDGSADKIGVGTSNPASKLQIVSSTSGDSVLKVDGTNGTLFEVVDDLSDSLMSVNDAAGLPVLEVFADSTVIGGRYNQNDFYIDGSDGRVGIGTNNPSYNLEVTGTAHVTGTFTAGTKSFLINHPTKEDHMLQYGSLEGPEYGVYVRGKTDLSEIELPEVWINLVHEGSITVSFTPRGKFLPLFLNKIENNTIYVGGTEGGVFYDYVVYGTRKDVDDLVTEFTK